MESMHFVYFLTLLPCFNAQQFSTFFLGRDTPTFGPSQSSNIVSLSQGQWQSPSQGGTNNIPIIPNYAVANNQEQGVTSQPWAPGEPNWFFPSGPEVWFNSCQRTGCPVPGTHCVFWRGFCPTAVRGTPCTCRRGCRVNNSFIPLGETRIVDQCNNICSCGSPDGRASCTSRRC